MQTGDRLGSESAPVTILLFASYSCSFCRQFDVSVRRLLARYPEHVGVVVKHFVPVRAGTAWELALGAECAARQAAFPAFHGWAMTDVDAVRGPDGWRKALESIEFRDGEEYIRCVESEATSSDLAADYEDARALGVSSAPTFFVNGEEHQGAVSFARLDSVVVRRFPGR
ncbi:MAG: thioredoxin domain-containing protein [Gemmatimonadota bacterium]